MAVFPGPGFGRRRGRPWPVAVLAGIGALAGYGFGAPSHAGEIVCAGLFAAFWGAAAAATLHRGG